MASCGFYGKIPSEGDFVSRRLPWEFTSAWDDWLAQGMQASRVALGPRWLELYLSAPIWRFQLAAGVCGPQAWRGLFFASVDRVGRYFPLTLAFAESPGTASAPSLSTLNADEATWLLAEDTALAALEPTLAIDTLDRLIEALAMPGVDGRPPTPADAPAAVAWFYTAGSDTMPPASFGLAALPSPASFVDLISPRSPASLEAGIDAAPQAAPDTPIPPSQSPRSLGAGPTPSSGSLLDLL